MEGQCDREALARAHRSLAAFTTKYVRADLARGGGAAGLVDDRREGSVPTTGYNKSCKCNRSRSEHTVQNSIVTLLGVFHAGRGPRG